jgi:PKD repeat protein
MTHQACPLKDKPMTRRVATLCRSLFAALLLIGLFPALTEVPAYAGEGNVDCHSSADGGSPQCTYPGKTECVERPSANNPIEAALIPQGESGCNKVISAGRVSTDFALEIPYDHCINDANGRPNYTNMPCWVESSGAAVGGNIGGAYSVTPVDKAYIGNPNHVCTLRAKVGNWAAVHCDFGLNYPNDSIVIEPGYSVNVFGAGKYGYMNWYTITVGPLGKPTASFASNPNTGVPGQYSFVSNSTDPGNLALDQQWTLGDGSTAAGPAVTHTYTKPGTYHVTLKVTNTDGRTDQVTHDVVVAAPKLSAAIAFVDDNGVLLPSASPQVGDTVNVRLSLFASDDGVGPVSGIGFTGDPLSLSPANLTDVTGPTPAIPAPSAFTLQPGASTSYLYKLKVLSSGVVRMTSTPFGLDAQGSAVVTQAAQLSFGISSMLVTVSLSPDHYDEVQTPAGNNPTDVTATITIKNISPDPVDHLNIRSIEPKRSAIGQLLDVAYKSGVQPDPSAGYALPDTLQPGASTAPLHTVFTVKSDGKIDFQSLVTGSSPTGVTLRGFGTAQLSVKPTKYLEFTSRVVAPGTGLLPAGTPIKITGTVHNLTSSDTLDVGPLYAKLVGNAGLQGLAYNGVGVDPKALTVPGALSLDPGDTKTFTLKVLTSYSEPTGAGRVKRSGGTSATVSFTPWAMVHDPDGNQFLTAADGSEILSTDEDLSHRVSIDDSIAIPEKEFSVLAGGVAVGAIDGVWNAASGLATGLIQLPNTAAAGLLAVTNYQATVWNSFTAAQKEQFAQSTASAIVPVLQANIGLAAEGAAKLFDQANAFTLQYFTTAENDWRVGNYAQTVQSYESLYANAIAQIAIPIGLGKLAASSEGVSAVADAQDALQTRVASLGVDIENAQTMQQVAELLTTISDGSELDPAQVTDLFGITPEELGELQKLAAEFRYLLTVRSRATSSINWLEEFHALVKPEALKIKSVSGLDLKLDYAAKYRGSLVFKEPPPLIELRKHGGQISDLVQAYVESKGFKPGDPEYYDAIDRVALRISEWNKYAKDYEYWDQRGWIDTSFSWGPNAMAGPLAKVDQGRYQGFHLKPTGVENEFVVEMFNGKVNQFVPVTGDIDPIAFTHLDGTQLDPEEHAALIDRMRKSPILATQHGESATFLNGGLDFIEAQFKANEAALQISPGGQPRIVRLNHSQSIWNSPTDYKLVWKGGINSAGGSAKYTGGPFQLNWGPLSAPEVPAQPGAPLPLPGRDAPNVGRCSMTYSSSKASLPLIMGPNGTLQQVSDTGITPSNLQSVCFSEGPLVNVSIRPTTAVAVATGAEAHEVAILTGPAVAGVDPNTGFAVGQQVVVGAGGPTAEVGTISAFGSIIFKEPLRYAHGVGDVIVEIAPDSPAPTPPTTSTLTSPPAPAMTNAPAAAPPTGGSTLARTGAPISAMVAFGLLLMAVGLSFLGQSRRRRRPRPLTGG